jgi:co-chaperonin GroES (HSP10)
LDVSRPKRQRKPKAAKGNGATEAIKAFTTASINLSGIWPTEFNVLVLQKKTEDKIGSIYLPDVSREREQYAEMEGTLIAVSPLAFTFERWPEGARKPQPGDKVIIAKYSGTRVVGKDGQTYLLTKDKDLSAIREA